MDKKRLTIDDHRRLGAELQAMRNRLVEITARLGKAYGQDDRIVVIADWTWREIDELRAALDKEIFAAYPSMPGAVLMTIYYPVDQGIPTNDRSSADVRR